MRSPSKGYRLSQMRPKAFDHVALWVSERDAIAQFVCDHLGMHEIDRTDTFTLVGADARRGKITLFDAEGPRERGPLERIVLRVSDLDAALARLPGGLAVDRVGEVAGFDGPEGIGLGLVERETDLEYDLDHVVLAVPQPERAEEGFAELGFERRNGGLAVKDKELRLTEGGNASPDRPLLNHLALLVDSASAVEDEARRRGIEIVDVKDAENTIAVFVCGPGAVQVEYVEHKPGFSLV
jgi:catechol 2,3-dioxygenase-like lactoylglutathione lyase family enzyme